MPKFLRNTFTIVLIFFTILLASMPVNISLDQLLKIEKKYGVKAKKRDLLWDQMLQSAKGKNTLEKLKIVNDFFNQITYKRDSVHWNKIENGVQLLKF